jgi:hypothetical protein
MKSKTVAHDAMVMYGYAIIWSFLIVFVYKENYKNYFFFHNHTIIAIRMYKNIIAAAYCYCLLARHIFIREIFGAKIGAITMVVIITIELINLLICRLLQFTFCEKLFQSLVINLNSFLTLFSGQCGSNFFSQLNGKFILFIFVVRA